MAPCRFRDQRHSLEGKVRPPRSHLVIEVIGGTPDVEFAVFDVAPDVHTHLHVVVSVADRDHVRVGVNIVLEALRVAVVGTETSSSVGETNCRNATVVDGDQGVVVRVTSPELVQNRWAERVNAAQRTLREQSSKRIAETASASRVAGTKRIRVTIIVVLDVEAVVAVPVVVQPERGFVAIEQVAQRLRLRTEGGDAALLNGCGPTAAKEGPVLLCRDVRATIGRHLS